MNAIQTQGLGKRFGNEWALESVEVTVGESEAVGFVGPSGAGKSVLLDLLLGRERPTEGQVRVFGADPVTGTVHERVGRLRERVDLDPRVTGIEHLDHAVGATGAAHPPAELLDKVGIDLEVATRPTETYSTGTRRLLRLAMALAGGPDLLFVEEPTAGLDEGGVVSLDAAIREAIAGGTAVVVFARRWSKVLDACDRVGNLQDGSLQSVIESDVEEFGEEVLELDVDHVPPLALESIPGVEGVSTASGYVGAVVSDPTAKATVVLEVGHADVAIQDLRVTSVDTGPVRREVSD
jgi:ABC-2 type transport system ATP-binding protein